MEEASNTKMIQMDKVSVKVKKDVSILQDVSIDIDKGEFVFLDIEIVLLLIGGVGMKPPVMGDKRSAQNS